MPKSKIKLPAWLPPWANEPLKFNFSPEEALRRGTFIKVPKEGEKSIRASSKVRR